MKTFIFLITLVFTFTSGAECSPESYSKIINIAFEKTLSEQNMQNQDALVSFFMFNNDEALKLLHQNSYPPVIEKWVRLEILRRKYNSEKTLKKIAILAKENDSFYPARISMALFYYYNGMPDKTISICEQTINTAGDDIDKYSILMSHLLSAAAFGTLAGKSSFYKKILIAPQIFKHIAKAANISDASADYLYGAGTCFLLSPEFFGRDLQKAETLITKSLQKRPLFPDAYIRLAQLMEHTERKEEAIKLMQKAHEINPNNPLLLDAEKDSSIFLKP